MHFHDTKLGKEINVILENNKARFGCGQNPYLFFVKDGDIPNGSGDKFARKMSKILKPFSFMIKYSGFDDNDYVFSLEKIK